MTMDLRSDGGRDAGERLVSITVLAACSDEKGESLLLERDNKLYRMSDTVCSDR
jgi:hypothetical protein